MSDALIDKFAETLDLWKRRAVVVFASVSLLIAMLVVLVIEVGGLAEVVRVRLRVDELQLIDANQKGGGTRHQCSCEVCRKLSK